MPKYWMLNDRIRGGTGTSPNTAGLTYWVTDKKPLNLINNWEGELGSVLTFESQDAVA